MYYDATATRPPARGRKRDDDISFDDDDILGGMGLDSPRRKPKSAVDEVHRTGGAKSIMGDLLGSKGSVKQHLERPHTGEKREFVLDKRYTKSAGESGQCISASDRNI